MRRVGIPTRDRAGSQWSLTFEVRKSTDLLGAVLRVRGSQWSLIFEVRKRPSIQDWTVRSPTPSQWSLTFEVRKRGR